MSRLRLTAAVSDYDHVRDLWSGAVEVEGIELIHLQLPVEEIFFRFTAFREWEVSEMSMGAFASLRSRGDRSMAAIPVFPSRVFRHSAIYVPAGSRLEDPEQLRGCRVGVPEWAQTAGIYARGVLSERYGVGLTDVEWYQAGLDQAGRPEKVPVRLPDGVRLTRLQDRTLDGMLRAGDLDAVISARPPRSYDAGAVRRLIRNAREVEEAYWRQSGVFPIMHVVVIRSDVLDVHPWVAMSLYKAFDEARRRGVERLSNVNASSLPIPWGADAAERGRELFGGEYWPYGLEPNRVTLQAFLRYAAEQGVCDRALTAEELFAASTSRSFRV